MTLILYHIRVFGLFGLLSLAVPFLSETLLYGQTPVETDSPDLLSPEGQLVRSWRKTAAKSALESGLSATARDIYSRLLKDGAWTPEEEAEIRLELALAQIAQGRYSEAHQSINQIKAAQRNDRFYLYQAMARYGDGRGSDMTAVQSALDRVALPGLNVQDRPWYYVMLGVLAEMSGKGEEADRLYAQAEQAAGSGFQRSYFEALSFRHQIRSVPSTEAIVADLKGRWERYKEDTASYPYVREYAIVLYNLGQVEEAREVIASERRNKNAVYGARDRDQLLLLDAMMAGPDSADGHDALKNLVRNGESRDIMAIALNLLARHAGSQEFAEFLNEIIASQQSATNQPSHPLLGQLYFLRSQMSLSQADRLRSAGQVDAAKEAAALAEKDAGYLLDHFPGMQQIAGVYRLLAYATLHRASPQYRVAADYLTQLRDQTEDAQRRQELNRMIGDCYFLNGDYSNAADFYEAVRSAQLGGEMSGALFLRLITAEVRAGQIEDALIHVDQIDFAGSISVEERWRVEWNLIQALQAGGELEKALERVSLLLDEGQGTNVSAYLDIRLRWLQLHLTVLSGRIDDGTAEAANKLYSRIEVIPVTDQNREELSLLKTEVLLLKAKVELRQGMDEAGLNSLKLLRSDYAASSAAQRSYMVEADYLASTGSFEMAQAKLSELANTYPQSTYAPEALFEAALNAERRGPEGYTDAIRLLDSMAQRYPDTSLLFFGRMRQGDLLRQMNNFAGALTVYENLINRYPENPLRYLAELSRADCMMALAGENPAALDEVVVNLERVLDLPNLPVDFQVEAGYKWAMALQKKGALTESREVCALMMQRFLREEAQAVQLDRPGRYWMSRTMLALAASWEADGDAAEAKSIYLKMIAYDLPGRSIAQARIDAL
ncbi:tetratricopeptide repeat protein [Coraliomargarita parva]|uniref:tetratricopeptide repeat protein n=1 Tax=Coraliomargarita parva TaxID=3014050 RepID=UPI0022B2DD46|nr:tetratricopeptide repeat protein [Coraliomargarita parva]